MQEKKLKDSACWKSRQKEVIRLARQDSSAHMPGLAVERNAGAFLFAGERVSGIFFVMIAVPDVDVVHPG